MAAPKRPKKPKGTRDDGDRSLIDGIAAPKPLTIRTELGRLVVALEVPDCKCKARLIPTGADNLGEALRSLPKCPHVREADHGLSIEEWAEVLLLFDPDGYADRPAPDPDLRGVLDQKSRERLYALRARAGEGLFHGRDWHQGDCEGVAVEGGKFRKPGGLIDEHDRDAGLASLEEIVAEKQFDEWMAGKEIRRKKGGGR